MDLNIIKQVVRDSAELLAKTAELTDQIQELTPLKQKVAELSNQNASLVKAAAASSATIVERVEKFAQRLVEHGTLTKENKVAFVDVIRSDPSQLVDVMEKLASQSSVNEIGSGNGNKTAKEDEADPIVRFAMGT